MLVSILFVVILWESVWAFKVDDCPHSIAHDKHNQVLGDKCFRFFLDIRLEFKDAQKHCKKRGGNLAMVKTKTISDFLTKHLVETYKQDGEFWIGLSDDDDENEFEWVDGSHLGSYSNWADSDEGPRGGIKHLFRHHYEDCVAMDAGSNGKWRDFRCEDFFLHAVDEHKLFICEFPIVQQTSTSTLYPHESTTATVSIGSFSKRTAAPSMSSSTRIPSASTTASANSTPMVTASQTSAASTHTTATATNTSVASTHTTSTPTNTTVITTTAPVVSSSTNLRTVPLTSSSKYETTTTAINPQSTKSPCTKLLCDLDCGMVGFKSDVKGCLVCECDF